MAATDIRVATTTKQMAIWDMTKMRSGLRAHFFQSEIWCRLRDSNTRPRHYE